MSASMIASRNTKDISREYNDVVARDLGILFVHGIGQQRRGETLVEFGEPLAEWLRRWKNHDKRGNPVIRWDDARLVPALETPDAPPHASGTLDLDKPKR